MSDAVSSTQEMEVSKLLEELRNNPIGTNDPNLNQHMSTCLEYLNSTQPPLNSSELPHWFCSKTRPVAVEAATFLLRLLAYSKAEEWKQTLLKVIRNCADCVAGLEAAKFRSIKT